MNEEVNLGELTQMHLKGFPLHSLEEIGFVVKDRLHDQTACSD